MLDTEALDGGGGGGSRFLMSILRNGNVAPQAAYRRLQDVGNGQVMVSKLVLWTSLDVGCSSYGRPEDVRWSDNGRTK